MKTAAFNAADSPQKQSFNGVPIEKFGILLKKTVLFIVLLSKRCFLHPETAKKCCFLWRSTENAVSKAAILHTGI